MKIFLQNLHTFRMYYLEHKCDTSKLIILIHHERKHQLMNHTLNKTQCINREFDKIMDIKFAFVGYVPKYAAQVIRAEDLTGISKISFKKLSE